METLGASESKMEKMNGNRCGIRGMDAVMGMLIGRRLRDSLWQRKRKDVGRQHW
jgi:hypothetical protein